MEPRNSDEFFEILHSGDCRAVERLLQWLDPFLKGVIHLRLIKNRLRMAVETMDVFQSLIKDFINPQANRRPPADRSGGIERYLSAAVHNKIVTRLRKEARHAGDAENHRNLVSANGDPAEHAANRDLVETVKARLSVEAKSAFDLRIEGYSWVEIGRRVSVPPDTVRMRVRRAFAGVFCEIGQRDIG